MKSGCKIGLAYFVGSAVILLTARLGIWQWQRATEKAVHMQRWMEAVALPPKPWTDTALPQNYQRLRLTGRWLFAQQILLDNRIENGRVGFHVITPMLLASPDRRTRIIAINRGWVVRPLHGTLSVPAPQTQTVIVQVMPLPHFFALQKDEAETIWQNLDWVRYQTKIGRGLQPVYTVALSDLGDGLKRQWTRPDLGIERNKVYAGQWFGLSVLTLGLMLYFTLRHRRRLKRSTPDVK